MMPDIDPYDDDIDYLTAFVESDDILAPDGDEDASRHLRWLRKARDEIEQIGGVFDSEIDKLEKRRDDLQSGPIQRAERLERLLGQYALAVRADSGLTKVALPHGTITTRAGSARIDITDADAVIAWWKRAVGTSLPIVHEVTTCTVSKAAD